MMAHDGGNHDADLDDDDEWLGRSPEEKNEKEAVIRQKFTDAKNNGISPVLVVKIESLIRGFDDVIKLRVEKVPPADIKPEKYASNQGYQRSEQNKLKYSPKKKNS